MSLEAEIARIVDRTVREAVQAELSALLKPPAIQREAMTVAEVAESLGMSDSWVRTAIREHGLPSKRVGENGHQIIPLGGLRAWLNGGES